MHTPSRSVLASLILLAFGGAAYAADATVQNVTVFTNTKAGSALSVLREHAERFGLPQSLNNLVLLRTSESLLGTHYHYQQMLRGLAVDRSEIVVSIGRNGDLLQIFNETKIVSDKADTNAVNQLHAQTNITSDNAMDKAWTNMKVQQPLVNVPKSELVWMPTGDGFQLAHKVEISAQMPTGGFVQYLNAQDGSLIDSYTLSLPRLKGSERSIEARSSVAGATRDRRAETAAITEALAAQSKTGGVAAGSPSASLAAVAPSGINGSGLVFDPDPRTALNNDSLTDTSAASAFEAAYFSKPLRDLTVANGVYNLSGPYVNIKNIEAPNTAPSTTLNGAWTAKRGNNAFDDTNVYFHLDQNQRYIQAMGFTGTKSIINRPLNVDTDGVNGDDNSHYSGGTTDYLAFGHGCVNDSEDADVILHEYGHGIQANINPNWSGGDTGGMGEGFGDYWAASYSYSTANGASVHPDWAFNWDGHGACWAGRMLNRTDARYNSSKTYGAHVSVTEGSVSFVSDELWSAPLFAAMKSLLAAGKPRANIDKIILEAHFGLGANVKMPAMATAIVNAARNLFPTDVSYENTFRAKFEAQNILAPTVPPGPTINETESNNSTATANSIGTAGTTVNASMASSTDVDYFKVSLPVGKTLKVTMTPNSSSDYDLELYSSTGTKLASSTNGKGVADVVSNSNTGTSVKVLYAKVYYYSGGTGATNGKYSAVFGW